MKIIGGKIWARWGCLAILGLVWPACAGPKIQTNVTSLPEPPPEPAVAPSTNPSPPDPVRFFTFGDWGTGDANQAAVAERLISHCAAEECEFGWLLGDNFYNSGVTGVDDPQWQAKFESVYPESNLPIPFYAVLGNHDHDGNEQAEIDYTLSQNRWKMPSPYYRVSFPATNPWLEFFAFDSVYGEVPNPSLLTQLASDLDGSPATWKVLVMHHPLYSNGSHGDTTALRDALVPVICNRVDVVLSGHDHLFSHIDDPNDRCPFQQFVVGTGGRTLYPFNDRAGRIYSESNFGFAKVEVTPETFVLSFYRSDGAKAYSTTLR